MGRSPQPTPQPVPVPVPLPSEGRSERHHRPTRHSPGAHASCGRSGAGRGTASLAEQGSRLRATPRRRSSTQRARTSATPRSLTGSRVVGIPPIRTRASSAAFASATACAGSGPTDRSSARWRAAAASWPARSRVNGVESCAIRCGNPSRARRSASPISRAIEAFARDRDRDGADDLGSSEQAPRGSLTVGIHPEVRRRPPPQSAPLHNRLNIPGRCPKGDRLRDRGPG